MPSNILFAQLSQNTDNLFLSLEDPEITNIQRINILNELAFVLRHSNQDTSRFFANKAIELSQNIDYKEGKATSYVSLGLIENKEGNTEAAITFLNEALKIRKELGLSPQIASVYNNLGLLYTKMQEFEIAEDSYKNALNAIRDNNYTKVASICRNNLGQLYIMSERYFDAIQTLEEDIKILSEVNNEILLGRRYSTLGSVLELVYDDVSAEKSFIKALNIYKKLNDSTSVAGELFLLGNFYFNQKKYIKSTNYYNNALHYNKFLDIEEIIDIKNKKAAAHLELNQIIEAKKLYNELYHFYDTLYSKNEKTTTFSKSLDTEYRINSIEANSKDLLKSITHNYLYWLALLILALIQLITVLYFKRKMLN